MKRSARFLTLLAAAAALFTGCRQEEADIDLPALKVAGADLSFDDDTKKASYAADMSLTTLQLNVTANRDWAVDYLKQNLPELRCLPPEGTYLIWLDMRALGLSQEKLMKLLADEAHVAVNNGLFFGEEGRGWVRVNLATQRANVVAAFEKLHSAIRSR